MENRGECWIYITQDETGRDQVVIMDTDPDDPDYGGDAEGRGFVLVSQYEPRFAPVTVALNIRKMMTSARARMN